MERIKIEGAERSVEETVKEIRAGRATAPDTSDCFPMEAIAKKKIPKKKIPKKKVSTYAYIYHGDCVEELKNVKAESVDLIITSPPYSDQRKASYGGVKAEKYVEWFLPIGEELKRVLKPDGTFILNIKEKVVNGERHTYVMELIMALREQGWLWTEEFIWHKKTAFPGKWPNRFRDAWERMLQFNKQKKFNMYQDEVMVPIGEWAAKRIPSLSEADKRRRESNSGSQMSRQVANWENRDMVYPTNVLHLSTETSNKGHSAVFPRSLPEWFIRLFSKEGDTVLDPFMGSGTTVVEALSQGRIGIGIEKKEEYYIDAKKRIRKGL